MGEWGARKEFCLQNAHLCMQWVPKFEVPLNWTGSAYVLLKRNVANEARNADKRAIAERERGREEGIEREREIYIYIHVYIYMHIFFEREIEREYVGLREGM